MHSVFMFLSLFLFPITQGEITQNTQSFEYVEKKQVDRFNFSGNYPQLENIDIDATRKYRVEMLLDGNYPILSDIRYKGSIGELKVKMTGTFHKLTSAEYFLGSTQAKIDLRGSYKKPCTIHLTSSKGDVTVTLPKDTGYTVTVHQGPTGRVRTELKQKGYGWLERHYENAIVEKTLTIEIETKEGTITLKE